MFPRRLRVRLEALVRKPRRPGRERQARFHPEIQALEQRTVLSFTAPVSFAAGIVPTAVAVGDFNGDGKSDIVTANDSSTGTVSTLLGNGDSTFQTSISSADGVAPSSIATGDFNGDGKLDVATTSPNNFFAIDLLFGNGDGTFQAPVIVSVPQYVNKIAVGDFNGDGHADIAGVSENAGGAVYILMNAGNGTFLPAQTYMAGTGAIDIATADMNNDGKLDLVVTNQVSNGTISTLLGNGDGTFQASRSYPAGSAPFSETIGDFNGDGKEDVAVLNSYTYNQVTIILGNGDGTYQPYKSYSLTTNYSDIETADFNGDDIPDLVETNGQVELGRGDGSFYAATTYSSLAANGVAVGDFNDDGSEDLVATYSGGSAIVSINADNDRSLLHGAVGLSVSAPPMVTAGATFSVTVKAVDANGNVVPGFLGTVGIDSSNTSWAAQANSFTMDAANAGSITFTDTLASAQVGTYTLSVTSPFLPTVTQTISVVPTTATRFVVSAPSTEVAGTPSSIMVSASDPYGNLVPGYIGTVAFSSSDVQAGLPANYTFTAADEGSHTFAITLKTAGNQTVMVASTTTKTVSGTSTPIAVTPLAAASLRLSGGGGFIASPQDVTIEAIDVFGNLATNDDETVQLTSSDPATVVSGVTTLVNGVGTISVTPNTLGTQTLAATSTSNSSISGSETVTVTPGWAASFVVTPIPSATAGVAESFTVTAYDSLGDVLTVYTGAVLVTTSDPRVGSFYYDFTAADAGRHTLSITFQTAGVQSLHVSDYFNHSVTTEQDGIAVSATTASYMLVGSLAGVTVGVATPFSVTLYDIYGNIATGYAGTVAFSTSDPQATLPTNYTFTAGDAGRHIFSATFTQSGGQTLSVQDIGLAALTYTQTDMLIFAGPMAGFSFSRPPASVVAGTPIVLSVSAVDAFGNPITGYTGTVAFGSSDARSILPSVYTFAPSDAGSHAFNFTLDTTGNETLAVQDTSNGSIFNGQGSISVKAAAASSIAISFPSTTMAGVAQSFSVTATDAFGNLAGGYVGTVAFSSGDVQAGLPASYTFTSKDAGSHTFSATLKTAGSQSISVTDKANPVFSATQSGIGVTASNSAGSFVVTSAATATAGVAQAFTVTVKDPFGNPTTGYTGTVTFSSSDAQAGLPANYTFTAVDAGKHVFSAILKTVGSQSISVKDVATPTAVGSVMGITVSASTSAKVASIILSGFPATTAGSAQGFTVKVLDAFGNIVTGYTGTVVFSSSDVQAGLPASYAFTAADAGQHTFSATLKTAGPQSITVRDASDSTIQNTQSGITVTAGAASRFVFTTLPASVTQGVGFKVTVTVLDAFGNIATGYRGKVQLSSTDSKAGTSSYTFSSSDNGVHTFSYSFPTLGSQVLSLVDTTNSSLIVSTTIKVVSK